MTCVWNPPNVSWLSTSSKQDTIIANQTNGTQLVNVIPMARDTGWRIRTSQTFTLFDGKVLNQEDTFQWDTKWTGTATFQDNKVNLSVTSWQYEIRQSKHWNPYFSGKPQLIETTYDNFVNEANVVKRVWYFSSNAVAPYDSDKDGVWLEADGTTYRLIVSNFWTEVFNIPWTSWDAYSSISTYDWSKFTVNEIDFLWLWGAWLRLFLAIWWKFVLVHSIGTHTGTNTDTFMRSPCQPIRYEIRSTTWTGSFRSICSQVSTEGWLTEEGKSLVIFNSTWLACNTAGTIYALKWIKKQVANRNLHIEIDYISWFVATIRTDSWLLMLIANPTLSAPLTYANNSRIQEWTATNQTITAWTWRILVAVPLVSNGETSNFASNALKSLPIDIDNTPWEYVLAYLPYTTTQTISWVIGITEY